MNDKILGRPSIPEAEKIGDNGLYKPQWSQIKAEAKKRGISAAAMLRQIVNWYFETTKERN